VTPEESLMSTSKPKAGDDAGALKPLRSFNPVGVVISLAEMGLLFELARRSTGWLWLAAVTFLALAAVGLFWGPAVKRKQYRRYMVAERAVARVKALRGRPIGAEDVFEVDPLIDRASFGKGYLHAMAAVETQIERAAEDVDAL
jgi:type II secretory pathway component PulM